MIKDDLLDALNFDNIIVHPKCFDELLRLINHASPKKDFLCKLLSLSLSISQYGISIIGAGPFEKLTGVPGVYSMKIKAAHCNSRVLFSLSGDNRIYLLAFEEVSGKSKSSYRTYEDVALRRKAELCD